MGEFSSKTIKELISLINEETSSNSLKLFKNDVKKLKDRNLLLKIFSAVREIKIDYSVGDLKTGDLVELEQSKLTTIMLHIELRIMLISRSWILKR